MNGLKMAIPFTDLEEARENRERIEKDRLTEKQQPDIPFPVRHKKPKKKVRKTGEPMRRRK